MKKENKPVEKKLGNTKQNSDHTSVRKNIDPLQKREVKEEDKKNISGDIVESHLGIDE